MLDTGSSLHFRMHRWVYWGPLILSVTACLTYTGCAGSGVNSVEDFSTREVVLPDGAKVRAEAMTDQRDMMRGMMFRENFPEGRGMLFFYATSGKYPNWTYQVKVPLDIIWMDRGGRVVEMVSNAAPCKTQASGCLHYGGTQNATTVLELPGGTATKHGIKVGETLQF